MWSASVLLEDSGSIKRWLQGDACSGILFNLGGPVYLDKTQYFAGVIQLPVSKQAHSVTLPSGSQLVGIRFHPGIHFGIFGTWHEAPVAVKDGALLPEFQETMDCLADTPSHYARIIVLYKWLNKLIEASAVIPPSLLRTLKAIQKTQTLSLHNNDIPLSQRQLERQFQRVMGMTPKRYQRILRVKNTLSLLKHNPAINLVSLALDNGFSDQAHMTREFKQIARITPKQYSHLVACRQI